MIKQYMKKNILKTNIMDEIIALMVDEDYSDFISDFFYSEKGIKSVKKGSLNHN